MDYQFNYDIASNQSIKEIITKAIFEKMTDKTIDHGMKLFKRDGTIYKDFRCIVNVTVGYKEDSYRVQWKDTGEITKLGLKTDDIDEALKCEYARWCL